MNHSSDAIAALAEKISFQKFSASANDFIVIDNRSNQLGSAGGELARRICARRYSVGGDGLILIETSHRADFRVRFFNPDGKEFSTCGNGGRCAARFARLNNIAGLKHTIETNIGVIDAEVVDPNVKLRFLPPQSIQLNVSLKSEGKEYRGHFVRLGDPHYVVYSSEIEEMPFVEVARRIRFHEVFGGDGANVHFIELRSRQEARIRSFERGVENETFACGSGCISAAVSTYTAGDTDPPIRFLPHSRIPVIVHFQPGAKFQDLYLEGDARFVYSGELKKEAVLGFPQNI